MTRTRLAAWNYAALLAFTVLTTATSLAVTPAVVAALGPVRNGAFKMVFDACGYLALLELGLGGALGPLLARAGGRDGERALRGVLAAGLRVYLGVALLIVALGVALTVVAPWLVPVPPGLTADLRRAWLIVVAGYGLLVLSPFRALAEAAQRGYRVNLLMTAQALVIGGGSLVLARLGWGITGQALALIAGNALMAASLTRDGLRRHPGAFLGALAARPDPEARRALWRLSGPTLAMNLCGRVGLLTDYLIVGNLLGPGVVTSLLLTQKLTALVQNQLLGVGGAAWAGLAELHARDQHETFRRRLVELTGLIAVLGLAALAPTVAYNHYLFRLWVPGQVYAGDLVVVVSAVNALLLALMSLWTWALTGTGQVRRALPIMAIGAALNLVASIALTRRLGPIGPLLGTTLTVVGLNLWAMPLLLRRLFGVSPRALALALVGPLAWGLPYAALLWRLVRDHDPSAWVLAACRTLGLDAGSWPRLPRVAGWLGLGIEMSLAGLGFLVLAWFVLLRPSDRALWRLRFGGLWPRAKVPAGVE